MKKCFLACMYTIASMQLHSASTNSSCTFLITDIRDYHVPTNAEITSATNSFLNRISVEWGVTRLVMPRTPSSIKLKIVRMDATKKAEGDLVKEIRAYKGCSFSLEPGAYRLLNDGHELKIEERDSDCNSFITVADSAVRASSGSRRFIKLYRYPQNAMVTLRGRVVDEYGHVLQNVKLQGTPICMDRFNTMCHRDINTITDKQGLFEFRNLSPASFDLAVRYLLFGRIMKDSFPSEKIFNFLITTSGTENGTNWWKRVTIPLVTQVNLEGLERTATTIRTMAEGSSMRHGFHANPDRVKANLPISTNNVIYIGDIVLPKKDCPPIRMTGL